MSNLFLFLGIFTDNYETGSKSVDPYYSKIYVLVLDVIISEFSMLDPWEYDFCVVRFCVHVGLVALCAPQTVLSLFKLPASISLIDISSDYF
jgi:hypothetical protein